jgi:SAM-dependent methyltransferase
MGVEPTAHGEEWFEANRAFWDERVPIHVGSDFYRVRQFLEGEEQLRDFELAELGDRVGGRTLFHPQCHFGQDTLSWARHGATVTGLDFSAPAVDAARQLAIDAGIDAEFVCAPVYDAVDALGGRTFDVVYTGLGAICWLPDLERWASVMAALCRPGGTFYLAEFHPFAYTLDEQATEPELRVRHDYFGKVWHDDTEGGGTYADLTAVTEHDETWERMWTIGEVVSAVADAGFRIELLHEHEGTLFQLLPFLEQRDGRYRLPDGMPSMPMMYSLRAVRG